MRFELHRYLGWPGQAPSYKVGERIWLEGRDEAEARRGAAFDLKAFHREALDLGSLGLDPLRRRWPGCDRTARPRLGLPGPAGDPARRRGRAGVIVSGVDESEVDDCRPPSWRCSWPS